MKKILNKLFASKEKWEFQKAELGEAEIREKNPARGWYTIYPFFLEKEPDFEELYWCLEKEETLALVIINIGAYQERALDETALQRLCRILAFFERHSYVIITTHSLLHSLKIHTHKITSFWFSNWRGNRW